MTLSLGSKFNILTGILVAILLFGFGAYNYSVASTELKQQQNNQVEAVVSRLAQSLPSTIWNFEIDQLISIIESEVMSKDTLGIFVYDEKGLIAGRMKLGETSVETQTLPESADNIQQRPMLYEDSGRTVTIGHITLLVDDTEINCMLRDSLIRLVVQTLAMIIVLSLIIRLLLNRIVVAPITTISDALHDIAKVEGDLTRRLSVTGTDEISALASSFNEFVEKISDMVKQVIVAAESMTESTEKMKSMTALTHKEASEQRLETDEIATAMHEMNASAQEVAQSAQHASTSMNEADTNGKLCRGVLAQTIDVIDTQANNIESNRQVVSELEKEVEDITSVLEVIRNIAGQTNLLALNAAIEAARAGEQGRGFAVVADEVRTLASRTQDSTDEIQLKIAGLQAGTEKVVAMIQQTKESSDHTVTQANNADASLSDITKSMSLINNMNTQIASAAEQQFSVTEDISQRLVRMVEISDATSQGTNKTQQASINLAQLANNLCIQMRYFKT